MIDNSLIPYIENNLKAGYQPEAIREYLVSQGYADQVAYDTIMHVEQQMANPQQSPKKLNMMVIVPLILVILVIIAVPVALFFMAESEPVLSVEPSEQQAQAFSTTFATGYEGLEVTKVEGNVVQITALDFEAQIYLGLGETRSMDINNDGDDDVVIELVAINDGVPDVVVTEIAALTTQDESDALEEYLYDTYDNAYYQEEAYYDEPEVVSDVVQPQVVAPEVSSIPAGFSYRQNAQRLLQAWHNKSVLLLKEESLRAYDLLGACLQINDIDNVTTYRIESDGTKNKTGDQFFMLEEYITENSQIYSDGTYGLVILGTGLSERLYFDEVIDENRTTHDAIDESELFVYNVSYCEDTHNFTRYVQSANQVTQEPVLENNYGVPIGRQNKLNSERLLSAWENKSVLLVADRFMRANIDLGGCWEIGSGGTARAYTINTSGSKELWNERLLDIDEYIIDEPGAEDHGYYNIQFWPAGPISSATFKDIIVGDEDNLSDTDGAMLLVKPQGYCDTTQDFSDYVIYNPPPNTTLIESVDYVPVNQSFAYCGRSTNLGGEIFDEGYDFESDALYVCMGNNLLDACKPFYVEDVSDFWGTSTFSVLNQGDFCQFQVTYSDIPQDNEEAQALDNTDIRCSFPLSGLTSMVTESDEIESVEEIAQMPGAFGGISFFLLEIAMMSGEQPCVGSGIEAWRQNGVII